MAAVAFFVYRRADLAKKVIESLKYNTFEKIYIFQDGYDETIDFKEWTEVSQLIQTMTDENVEVHISEHHKGLATSVIEGMNYVFERHETAIALEDDMYLSKGYSEFMDDCFAKYKNDNKVMCVAGSSFGTFIPENYSFDVYFSYRMSSAGFGTWRKYWNEFVTSYFKNPFVLKNIYMNPEKKKILDISGTDIEPILFSSLKGITDTWAAYWTLFQIDKEGLEVIPCVARAQDLGHCGDGTNSTKYTTRYDAEFDVDSGRAMKYPIDTEVNDEIMMDAYSVISAKGDEDRFKSYYPILTRWIENLYQGIKTEDYFLNNKMKSIYIYGYGKMGQLLYEQIKNVVIVEGIIEEESKPKESIIGISDKINDGIPIVITPVYDKQYICHLLKKYNVNNRIVWLEDVING